MILESCFDHIRATVLGDPRDGFFAVGLKANPNSTQVSLTYELQQYTADTKRMLVVCDYYGVFVGRDSRLPGPVNEAPDDQVRVIAFTSSDARVARSATRGA